MSLEKYKEIRHFNKSPEPVGGQPDAGKLQFVIQKHHASHLHYDFRLELRGVLKSWAVPKGPSMNPADKRLAQLVEDHPFDYKDFEGIIPAGNYGAGTVIIWDQGEYKPADSTGDKKEDEKLLIKQFYSGKMRFLMKGTKLKGLFEIRKSEDKGENSWMLYKIADSKALKMDVLKKDRSVVSGLNLEEMAANAGARTWKSNRSAKVDKVDTVDEVDKGKNSKGKVLTDIKRSLGKKTATPMPKDVEPMLATLIEEPFDRKGWQFEIKWDGYRAIAYVQNGKVDLRSRANQTYTKSYQPIADALKDWAVNAVVDGEIVVLTEEGKSDYEALQKWQTEKKGHLVYYVFDILWLEGYDLKNLELEKRQDILRSLLPHDPSIRFSDSIEDSGTHFFELARENGLEGIVAKERSSVYRPGKRGNTWLKIPTTLKQEFVIGGWMESDSGRAFKSLLFGYYEDGKLIYFGHGGGGFKEKQMPGVLAKLKKIEVKKKPFANETDREGRIHWVKPVLVADFRYSGTLTKSGKIRHPAIFLRFRDDKKPEEVVKEGVKVKDKEGKVAERKPTVPSSVKLTSESNWKEIKKQKITSQDEFLIEGKKLILHNVEKEIWNGVTRAGLIQYYNSVSNYLLPHVKDRALSLHIKHIGPTRPGLYIKDMEGQAPEWAEIYSMKRKHKKAGRREQVDYLVAANKATLLYIVDLGCIDVNPWTSRVGSPENPDYIIIDLDPSDEDFGKVIETAKAAKRFFTKNKIVAFPKTSGKSGMHLYLPCKGFGFPEARTIAEHICVEINNMLPDITTTEISVDARGDKLYIDPNQNDLADTVASAYSVRPWHIPTVSTPLDWKEVNTKLTPSTFTIHTILKRLEKKGDLFKDVNAEKVRVSNSKVLKKFL